MIKTDEGEYIKPTGMNHFDFTHNLSKIRGKKYKIIYQCENPNCSDLYIRKEVYLITSNKGFYIDNYNTTPIQFYDFGFVGEYTRLKENNLLNLNAYWTSIVYKDLKGILGLFDRFLNIKNEYSAGYIDYREYEYLPLEYNDDNKTQPIIAIVNNYISNKYIEYRRKEIGIMDVLAKIGALFSTFNFVFSSILKLYENNFKNYKIINKIMKDMNINYNEQKENKKENVSMPSLSVNDDYQPSNDEKFIDTIENEELKDSNDYKNNFIKKENKNRYLQKFLSFNIFITIYIAEFAEKIRSKN